MVRHTVSNDCLTGIAHFISDYNNIVGLNNELVAEQRKYQIIQLTIQKLESFYCSSLIIKQHNGWWNDTYELIEKYHGQIANEIRTNLDRIILPPIISEHVNCTLTEYFCKPCSKRKFGFAYEALWEALSHSSKKINELNERITLVGEQKRAWSELKNIFTKENK